MEVNLYHILFIVLVCITIVTILYPKKVIVKNQFKEVLSRENKKIINFFEVAIISSVLYNYVDIGSVNRILLSAVLIVYIQIRLKK